MQGLAADSRGLVEHSGRGWAHAERVRWVTAWVAVFVTALEREKRVPNTLPLGETIENSTEFESECN